MSEATQMDLPNVDDLTPPPGPEVLEETEKPKRQSATRARQEMRESRDQTLLDYLKSLSSDAPIRITLTRRLPRTYKGQTIEGVIDSYDEPLSEDDIKEMHGGGKYEVKVKVQNDRGAFVYGGARIIKISGSPKTEGIIEGDKDDDADGNVASKAVSQALGAYKDIIDYQRKSGRDHDPAISLMIDGLNKQLNALQGAMTEKDKQILELLQKPKEESSTDKLFGEMLRSESGRIQSIRTQHESEVRMLHENHRAEVERIHSRYEDQFRRQEDTQKREIDNLKTGFQIQIESLKTAQSSVVEGFKREIKHLDRELTKAQTELAEVRGRKEKSVVDMVTEMSTIQEALSTLKGDDENKESSTIERVISSVMDSPVMAGISQRIAEGPGTPGAPGAPAAPAGQPELPVNRPVQMPDGRVIVKKSDGRIVEIRQKKRESVKAGDVELDAEDVRLAITFMENAMRNQTDPQAFAATARNMIPQSILDALKKSGVDSFLSEVANLEPGSPLATQAGRDWVRAVAELLLR